jgi:hypothetical protein
MSYEIHVTSRCYNIGFIWKQSRQDMDIAVDLLALFRETERDPAQSREQTMYSPYLRFVLQREPKVSHT